MLKRLFHSRVALVVVAVAITAVVVSGVSWALQSPIDGGGVIHGCYQPKTGSVRLMVNSTCPKSEPMAIAWNQTGQQGEQGIQGPAGPSDTWSARVQNQQAIATTSPYGTDLASVTVPAGNYLVTAKATILRNTATAGALVACYLSAGTTQLDSTGVSMDDSTPSADYPVVNHATIGDVADDTTLTFSCNGTDELAAGSIITATQVGTLH